MAGQCISSDSSLSQKQIHPRTCKTFFQFLVQFLNTLCNKSIDALNLRIELLASDLRILSSCESEISTGRLFTDAETTGAVGSYQSRQTTVFPRRGECLVQKRVASNSLIPKHHMSCLHDQQQNKYSPHCLSNKPPSSGKTCLPLAMSE